MKTGFKETNKIKYQKPKDVEKSPFSFKCPQYDNRSSCFIQAGTTYGVGMRQPVGHDGNPKTTAEVLPKGRVHTLKVQDEYGNY